MRVVADNFKDFAYHCRHRKKYVCDYRSSPRKPRCGPSICPVIVLPLRGSGDDAKLKPGGDRIGKD